MATDSIFIWLKRTYANSQAHAIAAGLVQEINAWWTRKLREEHQLDNFLEIEFDTHYAKFFMPTVRGSDVGSKKRYAGLSVNEEGREEMVYRGLEMARSDWTPLARQFHATFISMGKMVAGISLFSSASMNKVAIADMLLARAAQSSPALRYAIESFACA